MQLHDLFLDGAAGHQPVDGHRSRLADAVGTIGGLVFGRRIPPRVHVDHVVGGGEVQARAARLERDQEHIALARLKCLHTFLTSPGRSLTIEVLVADAAFAKVRLDQLQMRDELREHQHLVAVLQQLVEGLGEHGQLGTGRRRAFQHQLRVAARQPQTRQVCEHAQVGLAGAVGLGAVRGRRQFIQRALPQGLVQGRLLRRQLHVQGHLGA